MESLFMKYDLSATLDINFIFVTSTAKTNGFINDDPRYKLTLLLSVLLCFCFKAASRSQGL